MIQVRLEFKLGDGIPWAGSVLAACDEDGEWTVDEPKGEVGVWVRDYLNARYGRDRFLFVVNTSFAELQEAEGTMKNGGGGGTRTHKAATAAGSKIRCVYQFHHTPVFH